LYSHYKTPDDDREQLEEEELELKTLKNFISNSLMSDIHLTHPSMYAQWNSYLNEYFGGLAAKLIIMQWNMDDSALSQIYLKAYNDLSQSIPVYHLHSTSFYALNAQSS
jgi:hypothetical protein